MGQSRVTLSLQNTDKSDSPWRNPIGFNEWVEQAYGENNPRFYDIPKMFMQQVDWITDNNEQISIDYIARFEKLASDFNALCKRLGTTATLPHLKSSDRGDYRKYYNKDSVEIIGKWFAGDIERFNYTFDRQVD